MVTVMVQPGWSFWIWRSMDVLHDLMLGRPWRPPAQASSRNRQSQPAALTITPRAWADCLH
jgi:hypothetical protein